jgi:transposase
MLLYDLTSTYAEGAAEENPMMRRGYSRDHRPDCEQLMLALVVNQDDFPFSYELFDGNRADVTTVEAILRGGAQAWESPTGLDLRSRCSE